MITSSMLTSDPSPILDNDRIKKFADYLGRTFTWFQLLCKDTFEEKDFIYSREALYTDYKITVLFEGMRVNYLVNNMGTPTYNNPDINTQIYSTMSLFYSVGQFNLIDADDDKRNTLNNFQANNSLLLENGIILIYPSSPDNNFTNVDIVASASFNYYPNETNFTPEIIESKIKTFLAAVPKIQKSFKDTFGSEPPGDKVSIQRDVQVAKIKKKSCVSDSIFENISGLAKLACERIGNLNLFEDFLKRSTEFPTEVNLTLFNLTGISFWLYVRDMQIMLNPLTKEAELASDFTQQMPLEQFPQKWHRWIIEDCNKYSSQLKPSGSYFSIQKDILNYFETMRGGYKISTLNLTPDLLEEKLNELKDSTAILSQNFLT